MEVEELKDLEAKEIYQLIKQLRHDAVLLGLDWAEAEHEYKSRKEMLPSILAEIQIQLSKGNKPNSVKTEALAYPDYIEKIEAMNKAQREANLKKVEYQATVESLKALTSVSYLRNSELKNLGS